ncbi:Gfo/Idh/MocA family oxidoreductase [Reinekea marina]|uniref:Gfo/Idh/MocA family oxidoreductase n=1 Tax=Reinekea marina TaxID=1310421 RepID=A0ABV7WSE7_9GAMM|nr:Gfo/Idh/MocA family oxidoreductase [Reinekea marina]MDN3649019.1 Gfo/Idh/MocA family oxidoreductase [Reinekea marina]
MIRTLVVGHGFSAQTFHIPFLLASESFEWLGSVSSKPDVIQKKHPLVKVYDAIDAIPSGEYDLAIVTTPNHLHFEQVKQLLEMDLHVVVEKPMVLNHCHATLLFDIAKTEQKVLSVFQNRRWDGDFLTVKSLLQNGTLGSLGRFVSRFDRFRPAVRERWRESAIDGAGILWDLGPHLLDQMVALFGRPLSITANVSKLRTGAKSDDVFEIWCQYPSHEVILGSSCFQAGPNMRFSVEGTVGSYIKHGLDVQENALKAGESVLGEQWGAEHDSQWGQLYQESSQSGVKTVPGNYGEFWMQLASAIQSGGANPVPHEDVLTVIELIEKAHLSSEQRKTITLN